MSFIALVCCFVVVVVVVALFLLQSEYTIPGLQFIMVMRTVCEAGIELQFGNYFMIIIRRICVGWG